MMDSSVHHRCHGVLPVQVMALGIVAHFFQPSSHLVEIEFAQSGEVFTATTASTFPPARLFRNPRSAAERPNLGLELFSAWMAPCPNLRFPRLPRRAVRFQEQKPSGRSHGESGFKPSR